MGATRGFTGRSGGERDSRLPPGQYDVGDDWPVLSAEVTPTIAPVDYRLTLGGLVEREVTWDLDELLALARSEFVGDIHCVTTWSKLGTSFAGVDVDLLLAEAAPLPAATHVLATSHTGYTTNLPLADVVAGQALVAFEYDRRPLDAEHGGPARLLVPHLYFWKSAKWLARIDLLDHDEAGFWELGGYHDRGDPWLEQRYQGD